jgi:hypothetical protein
VLRRFGIFALTFVVVIAGGIAFAQMGEYLPSADDDSSALASIDPDSIFYTATTVAEEPEVEETTPTTKPEEVGAEKPADEEKPVEEATEEAEKTTTTTVVEEIKDVDPPDLVITSPENGQTVSTKEFKFEGKVEPGATVKAAGYFATVGEDGYWSIVLLLENGGNLATIKAYDEAGNVSEAAVKVYYEAPAGEHAFSANQQKKVSDSNPPYDVFYGTGRPGSKITATSEFGSGSTTVNEKGKWEMKVKFPDAPYYQWFNVKVSDSDGHSKTFEFKSKYNPDATYDFTITQKYGVNGYQWEKFLGTATPGTVIGAYSEFGSSEAVAEGNGQFYLKVHFEGLSAGQTIGIVVETSEGDRRTFEFTYRPAPVEFSASQMYGSCSENPPYEKFYGTATPGTTVWAESPYGSGSTVADAEGNWHFKVFFEGATPGEAFNIIVEDSEGHSKTFSFIVLEK